MLSQTHFSHSFSIGRAAMFLLLPLVSGSAFKIMTLLGSAVIFMFYFVGVFIILVQISLDFAWRLPNMPESSHSCSYSSVIQKTERFFLSRLQLDEQWRRGHQRLQPKEPVPSEQPGGPGDPDSWRAARAHHRLRRHRLGPGLWLVGAGEAEPLRKYRVAPLHIWPGSAASGHRPQQRPHQDLGRLHW